MTKQRTAARWFAGIMVAGTIVVGAAAPAQAAPVSHSTVTISYQSSLLPITADTGWNGT